MEQLLAKNDYITDTSQLVEYFMQNCKNKTDFKVGLEIERLAVDSKTYKAAPYSGESGIAKVLKRLKNQGNFEEISENGNLLGLKGICGDITLEPGSQFECSTKPLISLKDHEKTFMEFNKKLCAMGEELGITWLGYGIQPLSTYENMEMIPKQRYKIMRNYLPQKGRKAPVMMMETAGIQTSIDYESEEDAIQKLRVSLGISPFLTAMFANSPIRGGKLTEYKSYRASSWLETDNDRCGLISRKIFEGDFGFKDYIEVLLDVPMFFIQRESSLIDMTHSTFRQHMSSNKATMDDWLLHMTTVFPDVRLKNFLEIRNCDCQRPDMTMAFPALIKGIFYNKSAMEQAWELVKNYSWQERNELRNSVPRFGLKEIYDIAMELVLIATESLKEEAIYLDRLKELLSEKKTPADIIIMNWNSSWGKNIKNLIHYSRL